MCTMPAVNAELGHDHQLQLYFIAVHVHDQYNETYA